MIVEFVISNWNVIAGMISFVAMALGGIATWMGRRAANELEQQSKDFGKLAGAFTAQKDVIASQKEALGSHKETLKFLADRVQELEEAHTRDYALIEEYRGETSRLTDKVEELTRLASRLTAEVEDLTDWGVKVLDVMAEANLVVPEPPAALRGKGRVPRKGPRL